MEPDIEKIISYKIKEAEKNPVVWDKTGTWSKIDATLSPQRSFRRFYYIAACIMAFLLIAFIGFINKNQLQNTGITRVEKKLEDKSHDGNKINEESTLKKGTEEVTQTVAPSPNRTSLRKKIERDETPVEKREIKSEVVPADDFITVPEEPNVDETIVEEAEKSLAAARVEPIIGVVIPEVESEPPSKAKRKNRFYKLDSQASSPWDENFKNSLLLARKK